jgi:hypothetical protein
MGPLATTFALLLAAAQAADPPQSPAASPPLVRERALPLPGPPADAPPPGAAVALPHDARSLSRPRREPEDRALALPRAVLTIPRVVMTGVFTPVSRTLSLFDDRVIARIRRAFLWNRAMTIGWMPLLNYRGGYGLTAGARLFHRDLFGYREELSVEATAGGLHAQAYELRFVGDDVGGARVWIDTRVRYDLTPRLVFQGIGDPSGDASVAPDGLVDPRDGDVRTRYSQARALAAAQIGYRFGRRNRTILPGIGVVFNHRTFGPAWDPQRLPFGRLDAEDPSIEQVYDVDRLLGFREGVDVARVFARLEIDRRDRPSQTSSGIHWLIVGGGAPPQARNVAYAHYGTELSAFVNLFARTRVLVARVALEAVEGSERRIPFSELPRLGGPLRLRGYRVNRFRDRKLVLGTLEYRYPIHHVVAGHVFVDVGRVARSWRELGEAKREPWRVGFGGGFTFRTIRRFWFRVELTYGEDFLVFFSFDPLQAFADRHLLEL